MAGLLGDLVADSPTDCISRLHYSRTSRVLLTASWDKTIRLYDPASAQQIACIHQQTPVLDAAFPDDSTAYTGQLSGDVRRVALPGGQDVSMGRHDMAVRCMEWLPSRGLLLTGSWDKSLKLWDPRNHKQPMVRKIDVGGKVFAMSAARETVIVATSTKQVLIYDIRKLIDYGTEEQRRESSLRFMTRSLAVYPDARGWAQGSVEGRVAMEVIDMAPAAQTAKYSFKCHRKSEPVEGGGPKEMVYPVHCIAYHDGFGTFATGGGDGVVNIWDGDNKKRLFQIQRYPTSVSALAFSPDGLQLAVASSYCYEEGEKRPEPPVGLYLRPVAEAEVKPKPRQQAPPPA